LFPVEVLHLNRLKQVSSQAQSSSLASYTYTLGAAGNRLTVAELENLGTDGTFPVFRPDLTENLGTDGTFPIFRPDLEKANE
jgi:hypothetical protein